VERIRSKTVHLGQGEARADSPGFWPLDSCLPLQLHPTGLGAPCGKHSPACLGASFSRSPFEKCMIGRSSSSPDFLSSSSGAQVRSSETRPLY